MSMGRADKIKTKLDLLKLLIVTMLTALFGIIGFVAVNYKTLDLTLSIGAILGIIVLSLVLVYLGRDFNKELNKLEKE